MEIKNPEYFGQRLHKKGFRVWFLYMFRLIEGFNFIEEAIHKDLFQTFQDIYDQKTRRNTINVPPRSAKTTMAKYFIAYCLAPDPKCNFIYTSYSQSLLGQIATELSDTLLKHPVYRSMYNWQFKEEIEEINPIDQFWKEYLEATTGKSTYSSKKIVTSQGGVILFASVGASITGYGAGQRCGEGYTGGLIIDDANKPADIYSVVMRRKVQIYFEETLLSRLNNSKASITNIQQRLHKDDLSAFLDEYYKYTVLKSPLIVDGVCQLPSQYDDERLAEIQTNNFMFQAQFQQNPLNIGGNIIKPKFLKEYSLLPFTSKRWITVDTGIKTGKKNDFTVMQGWGRAERGVYLIDQVRFKTEYPELKKRVKDFWNKHNSSENYNSRQYGTLVAMYIEDKASGSQIIQEAKAEAKFPVVAVQRNKNKLQRVLDILLPKLDNGYIHVPEDAPWLSDYKKELEEFTGEDKHEHDDQVDCTIDGVEIGFTDMLKSDSGALKSFKQAKIKARRRANGKNKGLF